MRIVFPYPGYEEIKSVDVPDSNLLGVYSPRAVKDIDEEAILERGFAEPYAAQRLREVVRSTDRVLILVDDVARGTPVPLLLHYVLRELRANGVHDKRIVLLTAQGSHGEMGEVELKRKLGEFYGSFKLHQHRWLDESSLHDFGLRATAPG